MFLSTNYPEASKNPVRPVGFVVTLVGLVIQPLGPDLSQQKISKLNRSTASIIRNEAYPSSDILGAWVSSAIFSNPWAFEVNL